MWATDSKDSEKERRVEMIEVGKEAQPTILLQLGEDYKNEQ